MHWYHVQICKRITVSVFLKSGKLGLCNDEAQDIKLTEQMAIYTTFKHDDTIGEHFVGIILISKLVESTLKAIIILSAVENYLQSLNVLL